MYFTLKLLFMDKCIKIHLSNELRHEKKCFMLTHPRRLISVFVVRSLDSIIPILATSKVSRL